MGVLGIISLLADVWCIVDPVDDSQNLTAMLVLLTASLGLTTALVALLNRVIDIASQKNFAVF